MKIVTHIIITVLKLMKRSYNRKNILLLYSAKRGHSFV